MTDETKFDAPASYCYIGCFFLMEWNRDLANRMVSEASTATNWNREERIKVPRAISVTETRMNNTCRTWKECKRAEKLNGRLLAPCTKPVKHRRLHIERSSLGVKFGKGMTN